MLKLILDTIKKAGRLLLIRYEEHIINDKKVMEKGYSDFVTEVDIEIENFIKERLEKETGLEVLGEETSEQINLTDSYFLIDPIDGTRNFIRKNPHFAINIAFIDKKEVICAATYDPVKNELFWAEAGKGSYLNGEVIRVSQNSSLSKAIVAMGLPYRGKEHIIFFKELYEKFFLNGTATRHTGSAALDLAYIACGRYDAMVETYLSPWDVASGILLVKEAGGLIEGVMDRKPDEGWIFASSKAIFNTLYPLIRDIFEQ